MSLPSKKATGSRNQRLFWICLRVSKKINIITKVYEMLNTMNKASMLQGKNPPPSFEILNHT